MPGACRIFGEHGFISTVQYLKSVFATGYRAARLDARLNTWLIRHFPASWHRAVYRRARWIPDPIERLRYLQRLARCGKIRVTAANLPKVTKPGAAVGGCLPRAFSGILPASRPEPTPKVPIGPKITALLLICIIGPVQIVSDGTSRVRLEPDPPIKGKSVASVWLVEGRKEQETYSNGLRIENQWAVAGRPRSYVAFPRERLDSADFEHRIDPAGIVFHSTQSDEAPFEERHNSQLKLLGRSLLEYVREKRAYHFVIDRFGRVYRMVHEKDSANHAGYSLWADANWLYVSLNTSFLAVAFESQSRGMTPAQMHAGRMLTEMLRAKYDIPGTNCLTHAQVSVNPGNMRIGYHTDWASGFPFFEIGLPNNYSHPLAALYLFGFDYDSTYLDVTGGTLRQALSTSERLVREQGLLRGISAARYKELLRERYRSKIAALKHLNAF